jgi:glycosyltransferase involved in cell wall biosynthesis
MVLIFDSHPVQYKAPVYQRLQQLMPDSFQVIYATDSSVRGHHDLEFGKHIAWDVPLLEGYAHRVLHNERGAPFSGFRSLTGRGVYRLLREEQPSAVLISQFIYEFDLATFVSCLRLGIPIWIRQETQDEAFVRPPWKSALRTLFYRAVYSRVDHAFYLGHLNREHLLRHGVPLERMTLAPYCTPIGDMTDPVTGEQLRKATRKKLGIEPDEIAILFSGKLIDKKNPQLLLDAFGLLSPGERARFKLIFVGSGPLEELLRTKAAAFPGQVHFAGFLNQSEIASHYLAADIMVLLSRRAGETWGLVVNEALQAGCSVVMTDAVGCHREFGAWERVRVIRDGDARACAQALGELAVFPRSFDWCGERMKAYSVEAAATALAQKIGSLDPRPIV